MKKELCGYCGEVIDETCLPTTLTDVSATFCGETCAVAYAAELADENERVDQAKWEADFQPTKDLKTCAVAYASENFGENPEAKKKNHVRYVEEKEFEDIVKEVRKKIVKKTDERAELEALRAWRRLSNVGMMVHNSPEGKLISLPAGGKRVKLPVAAWVSLLEYAPEVVAYATRGEL